MQAEALTITARPVEAPGLSAAGLGSRRFVAIFAGLFVLLFSRSMYRAFDLDEHLFVAPAAVLDLQGAQPYRDYLYFHVPSQVYLYAGLFRVFPYKLLTARTVSVLCGTTTCLLLLNHGFSLFSALALRRRWILAGGPVLCLICARLFTYTNGWSWNHDSAVLCALAALFLHFHALRTGHRALYFLTGLLAGMAIGIRLTLAVMILPHALAILFLSPKDSWTRRLLKLSCAVIGTLFGLLPALWWFFHARQRFLFGTMGYQTFSRRYYTLSEKNSMTVLSRIGHLLQTMMTDPGNLAIFAATVTALVLLIRGMPRERKSLSVPLLLTAGILIALVLGDLGPSPSQYQYHYMLLPFMVLFVMQFIASGLDNLQWISRWVRGMAIASMVAGVLGLPRWYWPIVRLPLVNRWVPVQLHRTGLWVRDHAGADARVLTIDPLVPLEGDVRIYPQFAAGRFVVHVGNLMTPADREKYSIVLGEPLQELLRREPADAVLCDHRTIRLVPDFVAYARSRGFQSVDSPDGQYTLWTKPPSREKP